MRHGNIDLPMDRIEEFCQRWRITEMSLFGSVLRDDFRPDSDIDVMVRFEKDVPWSLLDIVRAERELGEMLGRRVDLSEREAIEASENYIFRQHALSNTAVIYAA